MSSEEKNTTDSESEKHDMVSGIQNPSTNKTRTRSKSGARQKKNAENIIECKDVDQETRNNDMELANESSISEPQSPSPNKTRTRSKSGSSVSTTPRFSKELVEVAAQEETISENQSPKQSRSSQKSASACSENVSANTTCKKTKRKSVLMPPKFRCNECKKRYSSTGALQNHIQYKHMGIVYSCKFCDYKSGQAGSLRIHLKKHST